MTVDMRGALHKDHLQIDRTRPRRVRRHGAARGRRALESRRELGARGRREGIQSRRSCGPGFTGALDFDMKASGAPFGATTISTSRSAISPASCAATPRPAAAASLCTARTGRSTRCVSAPAIPASPSMASSAHHARSTSISASMPTISRCWPRERAASCTRAARSAAHREAPVIKLTAQGSEHRERHHRASTSSPRTSISTGAGSATSHADIAVTRLEVDQRSLTQFNATLDGTTADHIVRGGRARRQDQPASVRQGRIRRRRVARHHRRPVHRRHRQYQSAARCAGHAHGEREGGQARCAVHAWQGRAPVRRGELEPEAGWTARADAHNLPISTLTAGLTPQRRVPGHR